MKIDTSGCNRVIFPGCRLHCSVCCLFSLDIKDKKDIVITLPVTVMKVQKVQVKTIIKTPGHQRILKSWNK